jgi:hypothetical protein
MHDRTRITVSVGLLCAAMFFLASDSLHAQVHLIRQDTISAWSWFGGDDRPNFDRNVGSGQRVRIDTDMTIGSFSLHFNDMFDYSQNPDGHGHEVTLRLQVRDSSGTVIKSDDTVLPESFTGGWVLWNGLKLEASEGTSLVFTVFLVGGYDNNKYTSTISASATDQYPHGTMIGKYAKSDEDFADWTDWTENTQRDLAFFLRGTRTVTSIDASPALPEDGIQLLPNYPNPVRGHTRIAFSLSQSTDVSVTVYNLLGERVAVLTDEALPQGVHHVDWAGIELPSGSYRVLLQTPLGTTSRLLNVLR